MKRVPLTVSLPPDLARKFERWAKAEAKNKSQLFRDMFRAYEQRRLEQEFFELQRNGARQVPSRPAWDVRALHLSGDPDGDRHHPPAAGAPQVLTVGW